MAALVSVLLQTAHADPQSPPAPAPTTDPSMRPNTPLPVYPPASRKKQEAGVVRLSLCIDAAGRVSKADLTQSSGFPNLDNAVLKWAQDLQVNPAKSGATPVAVCDFPFKYEFQVTKGPDQLMTRTTNPFDIGPPGN
jgi:protein TonB